MASQGCGTTEIAKKVGVTRPRVLDWIKRFNVQGMAGLDDMPRSGRPATYSVEEVSTVIATALSLPDPLGLPFGSWTLDRLAAYLNLIEPWWKILRSLALKGRCFTSWDDICTAVG